MKVVGQILEYFNLKLFLLLIICFISCKTDVEPPNDNEMHATVILSPGNSIIINAKGTKTLIGCSLFGGGTFIQGTSESDAAVYLTILGSTNCISSPGIYGFTCEFRKNVADPNTPIYSNYLGDNHGSITFSEVNDNYVEGFFNATCRCFSPGCTYDVDSVIVSGSFKGNFFSN